jgi:hypothetical protein
LLYIINFNTLINTNINFLDKYNLDISLDFILISLIISFLNKYNLDKGLGYLDYKILIINIGLTNKINFNRLNISFNSILDIKKPKNINK